MFGIPSTTRKALIRVLLCFFMIMSARSASGVSHVIHISIDGLRGDLLESYINTSPLDYPNFKRFVDEGATTFNARTDYSNTETLPNHTSMLTGRPVDQPSGTPNTTHHGYVDNGVPPPSATLHNSGNPNLSYVASTFDVVHDNGLSTALYASKDRFSLYEQSYNATTGAPDTVGIDNGRDKIDHHLITTDFISMHTNYLSDMVAFEFNYSFLHYLLPDGVGHSAGWGSEAWNSSVRLMDEYMGDILELIDNHAAFAGDTIIILTADHGGTGTGHGNASTPANYTIPLLIWGAGVAPGADLYALNPISRLNPGTGRPSYTATNQPIRNGDTGNLAINLLGLVPISGSTINAQHDLLVASAFEADFDANQIVNLDDLIIWQTGFGIDTGATKAQGDATSDGSVDGKDFLVWQRQYGASLVNTLTAVPEPNSLILVFLGIFHLHHHFIRRRQE